MQKRDSLRRWKARCRLGRLIPLEAIVDWMLDKKFIFERAHPLAEVCRAVAEREG